MRDILKTIAKVAATNLGVLITGETGTGKEIIARALHEHSPRAPRPFVAINCAAVPKDLLESQMFGYRRGAFSGASEPFGGVIRAASGGTLLLDEVGEIPIETQPKLLRFLESGEIHPLGESLPIKVDVRLLFATNAPLEGLVKAQKFREDLLFRINVVQIKVPPLRERREEIPLFVQTFAQRYSREMAKDCPKFSSEAMEHLVLYSWPGNIRQLNNEIRRLVAIADGSGLIMPTFLSDDIRRTHGGAQTSTRTPNLAVALDQHLGTALGDVERAMLLHALKKANGHMTLAARMLGLSRKGLYLKRQRLGMLNPDEPAH